MGHRRIFEVVDTALSTKTIGIDRIPTPNLISGSIRFKTKPLNLEQVHTDTSQGTHGPVGVFRLVALVDIREELANERRVSVFNDGLSGGPHQS